MGWALALAVMIGLILTLMGVGVPVAFAFFATNIVCLFLFMGGSVGVAQMVTNFGDAVSIHALTPMPLFLIMGSLFFRSGLGDNVFKAIDMCIGNLRARLSYLVVLAGAVFASLSGSSLANTGMMGSSMVPEMLRRGYKPHMVYGPVLGAGGLAVIIPPSSLAVLLGSLAQIDVGAVLALFGRHIGGTAHDQTRLRADGSFTAASALDLRDTEIQNFHPLAARRAFVGHQK